MYIDAQLLFFEDTPLAATMTSDVLDLGTSGAWLSPLYIDVKLSEATSAAVSKITVLSGATDSTVTTEEMSISPGITGANVPMTVAQFFAPIRTGNRYIKIQITSTGSGKINASMVQGVSVK